MRQRGGEVPFLLFDSWKVHCKAGFSSLPSCNLGLLFIQCIPCTPTPECTLRSLFCSVPTQDRIVSDSTRYCLFAVSDWERQRRGAAAQRAPPSAAATAPVGLARRAASVACMTQLQGKLTLEGDLEEESSDGSHLAPDE